MGFKRIGVSAAALAGAAALAFGGVASAATAVAGTPTGDLQMCGSVYTPGPWSEFGPVSGTGASGVTISGSVNGVPVPSISAVTGADGSYCVQGTEALSEAIFTGGYAELVATKASTTFTTGTASSSPHTWSDGTTTHIDFGKFSSHICGPFTSVCNFNFVVPA